MILIVEDEPLIALDLGYACADAGLAHKTAATSRQAMAILKEGGISGLILDINLGRGETCEGVAAFAQENGIPFVLNTGDLDRVGETLREMNAPIIAKPSSAEAVVSTLLHGMSASPVE